MIIALLAAAALECAADGMPAGAVELVETVIPNLTAPSAGGPPPYAYALIPAGWVGTGGVAARPNDPCGLPDSFAWRAISPDGAERIEILPAEMWTASRSKAQFSSCPSKPFMNAVDYVAAKIRDFSKDAELGAVRLRDELVADYNKTYGGNFTEGTSVATAAEQDFVDARAGTEGIAVSFVVLSTPGAYIPENEPKARSTPSLIANAPAGRLNRALIEAVRSSFNALPAWRDAPAAASPAQRWCGRAVAETGVKDVYKDADGRFFFILQTASVGEGQEPP